MFAGNHGLDHLIAIVDYNKLQVDGSLEEVNSPCPIADKFEAFKWEVLTIDGNDVEQVADALERAMAVRGKPVAVIADTVKGKGVSIFEGGVKWHGNRPNEEEYRTAFGELDQRIREEGILPFLRHVYGRKGLRPDSQQRGLSGLKCDDCGKPRRPHRGRGRRHPSVHRGFEPDAHGARYDGDLSLRRQ